MADTLLHPPDRVSAALAGRYAIVRELGRGGMATVYLAHDVKHHRPVAIKVLRPELAASLGAERFLREIEVAAGLQHPHILPLHDSGEADGLLYYVMPYVDGESLRDRLTRERQLPVEEVLEIARDVADALDHAHRHGVVHRDIKPENILLQDGRAVVADFGIARAVGAAAEERLTGTGLAVGTPAYMSPEQATADPHHDGRSDVYSLACVVYEMLAGEPPFTGPSAEAVIAKRLAVAPAPLSVVRETIPAAADDAMARALARTPADRFPTAGEFIAALSTALHEPRPHSRGATPSAPWWRLHRRSRAALGAVALVGVAGVAWGVRRARPATAAPSADVVAVLPFAVRGGDRVAYLGDGIAELLSVTLDGAGSLRTADSRAVLGLARQYEEGGLDAERARAIAGRVRAGRYVHGEIVEVAGRLRLTGALYDAAGDGAPRRRTTVEGNVAEWFDLVDRLGAQLLAGEIRGSARPLAEATTESVVALKAYLEGEAHLRDGQFEPAAAAFERAIRADSAFSLAHHRLAFASSFGAYAATPPLVLARRAVAHSARLSARGRMATDAFRLQWEGRAREAERFYRQILGRHPEDVEASFLLGTLLVYYAPRQGRSVEEARAPLQRVLAHEPDHENATWYLAEMAAGLGRRRESDSLFRQHLVLKPRDYGAPMIRALLAFGSNDTAAQDRAVAEVRAMSDVLRLWTVWGVAAFTDDMEGAERVARVMTEPSFAQDYRAEGFSILSHVRVRRGLWRAAWATLDTVEALDEDEGRRARGHLALVPLVPVTTAELREARRLVADWQPGSAISQFRRLYLLGTLGIRLGDTAGADAAERQLADAARRFAAATDSIDGEPAERLAARARDLSFALRAHLAWARGQPAEALAALDRMNPEDWWQSVPRSLFFALSAERFLRAEALAALGRHREAIRWYETLGPGSQPEIVYLPARHLRLAELYERLGQPDSAAAHYERLAELWRDGDPEVRPVVDSATTRAARLRARR